MTGLCPFILLALSVVLPCNTQDDLGSYGGTPITGTSESESNEVTHKDESAVVTLDAPSVKNAAGYGSLAPEVPEQLGRVVTNKFMSIIQDLMARFGSRIGGYGKGTTTSTSTSASLGIVNLLNSIRNSNTNVFANSAALQQLLEASAEELSSAVDGSGAASFVIKSPGTSVVQLLVRLLSGLGLQINVDSQTRRSSAITAAEWQAILQRLLAFASAGGSSVLSLLAQKCTCQL